MLGNVTHYEHLSNMILHKKQIAEKYFDKKKLLKNVIKVYVKNISFLN